MAERTGSSVQVTGDVAGRSASGGTSDAAPSALKAVPSTIQQGATSTPLLGWLLLGSAFGLTGLAYHRSRRGQRNGAHDS